MIIKGINDEIWETITMEEWDILTELSRDIILMKDGGIKFVKVIRGACYLRESFSSFEIIN